VEVLRWMLWGELGTKNKAGRGRMRRTAFKLATKNEKTESHRNFVSFALNWASLDITLFFSYSAVDILSIDHFNQLAKILRVFALIRDNIGC